MRPLNPMQARQDSGRSLHSPIFDYKVVVLGVMYPDVFSRQPSNAAIEEATHLLHDLTFVRRNTAVIFYDPFSPDGSGRYGPASDLERRPPVRTSGAGAFEGTTRTSLLSG
jgi:hypothetical protein